MKAEEIVNTIYAICKFHPNTKVTFGNNKVPITKIVYDETTDSVNLR